MISSFIHSLSALLSRRDVLLFKGEEERTLLADWLLRDHSLPIEEPVSLEVDRDHIREIVARCARCVGAGEKKMSYGSGANGVMILLHIPEKITTHEMKTYRAQSNEILRKMLSSINIEIGQCYLTSLIKCEGSAIHQPSRMFLECADILRAEIAELDPKIVIVMGSFGPVAKLSKEYPDTKWFNTEHPVTLIKNPDLKRGAWETLKLVRAWIDGR